MALVVGFLGSGSDASGRHGHERPIRVRWSGTFEIVPDGDWCGDSGLGPVLLVAERGRGTPLGRFTAEGRHCADLEAGVFVDGVIVFVAANGDELRGTYSGKFLPELPDGTQRVASTHVYTGGTGRFANATGQADAPAWFRFTSETEGVIRGSIRGRLSLDGPHGGH